MMKRILAALDGSDHSTKALDLAADLADLYGAELLLVHVLSATPLSDSERHLAAAEYEDELALWSDRQGEPGGGAGIGGHEALAHYSDLARHFRELVGKRLMASAEAGLRGKKLETESILAEGDPAATILQLAEARDADCIVIGSLGLGGIKGLLLGSVSHKVSQLATCTCISVK
jgi:nucleotide-binding universal stress UspA family protein